MSTATDSYVSYNYKKHTRLSHEEVLIPLVYWSGPPKHAITAILVHKSLRFGEMIVTGSTSGEFVLWKGISHVEHDDDGHDEDDDDDDKEDNASDHDKDTEWIAMAMTFSSNTSSIISIVGLTTYRDEICFAAIHSDGELEIYSIAGSGALKIGRSDTPILSDTAIRGIFPYKKCDDAYQYMLCSNFHDDGLHLIDLNKGTQIGHLSLSNITSIIIDLVFLNDKFIMETFVIIDCEGAMGVFRIDIDNTFEVLQPMQSQPRLRNKPVAMDITVDDQYIVVISHNEFVIYRMNDWKLQWMTSKTERNVHWNGILVFDSYIHYKMLPGFDDTAPNVEPDIYKIDNPFFVFLWEDNAPTVTLYLVSKDTCSILVPIVELIVFEHEDEAIEWSTISHDDEYLYIGTLDGQLTSFCIETLVDITIDCYGTLLRNNFSSFDTKIGELRGNTKSGDIRHSFNVKTAPTQTSLMMDDRRNSAIVTEQQHKDILFEEDEEEEDEIVCSCINITNCGVLLCLGHRSGLVYIYNITECKPLLEIHTKTECVTCLLLLCLNENWQENDGILFIGYADGVIEIFNICNNACLFHQQCHFGAVQKLCCFEGDYYVFAVGADDAISSFLVYSEVATMKGIMKQIRANKVKWMYYRALTTASTIACIYRNEWCLLNDYVVIEMADAQILVWSVATAQTERHLMNELDCHRFKMEKSFPIQKRRSDIIDNLCVQHQLYNTYDVRSSNANLVILDIVSIFKGHSKYNIDDILRVLSLLLDWDIMTQAFNDDFCDDLNRFLFKINYLNRNSSTTQVMKNDHDLYNLSLIKHITPCFGFIGDYNSITMLFPIASRYGGKWKMHSKITSVYMLGMSTLCLYLRKQIQALHEEVEADEYEHVVEFVNKELIAFYSVSLPSNLSGFVEPSHATISRCCLSSTSSLRKTARLLLENMVQRMTPNAKKGIVLKWKERTSLSALFNAILICIIHTQQKEIEIGDAVSLSVIRTFSGILNERVHHKSDMIKKSLCCYYLGRVITSWFMQCDRALFVRLLNILLDLFSDYDDSKNKSGTVLSESAMYALIECGVACPQVFIQTMGLQALQISKRFRHSKALQSMQRLIYTAPLAVLRYIPFMVRTIIKCLDPSSPQKRKTLLKAITATLHAIVHKFPNCSFHSKTQHFAIGTGQCMTEEESNCIIIYDLRTATKFGKTLKHEAQITAIEFNEDGKYLVSYSPFEQPPLLCIWRIQINEGVLQFFSSGSRCIKLIQLNPLTTAYSTLQHITNTQITWPKQLDKQNVKLQREDKSVLRFEIS